MAKGLKIMLCVLYFGLEERIHFAPLFSEMLTNRFMLASEIVEGLQYHFYLEISLGSNTAISVVSMCKCMLLWIRADHDVESMI